MSCLFNSLGRLLEIQPTTLRHQICDFIISHPDAKWDGTKISDWIQWVAGDQYKTIQQYIAEMRNLNKWGGAPEIAICCMIYDISIEVINYRDRSANVVFKDESRPHTIEPPPHTQTAPLIQQQTPFAPSQNDLDVISTMWNRHLHDIHMRNPTLHKMSKFPIKHPLRKNYNSFMNDQKQYFYNKLIKQMRDVAIDAPPTVQQTPSTERSTLQPIVKISWTGNHYEPVGIKNRRRS